MKRIDENKAIKLYLLNNYVDNSYKGVEYVHAIRENGRVKAAVVEDFHDIIYNCTVCERSASSKGDTYRLRAWNCKESFDTIKTYAKEIIDMCSVEEFEEGFKAWKNQGNKGNRGNYFEPLYCGMTGAVQVEKANAKFTDSGDVVLNGKHQQLKLWNATYTDTETIKNLNK